MTEATHLPMRRSLDRTSPFSYRCAGCGRCCRDKLIQVNPYEVARIAGRVGLSTTDALARYTEDGVWLRREADGTCCFLRDAQCAVHGDQPLACRLYPLGHRIDAALGTTVVELEPHPESAGSYGTEGTVDDYFASQGVSEYLEAANRYFKLLGRMAAVLERRMARVPGELAAFDFGPAGGSYRHQGPLPTWLDVDAMIDGAGSPADLARPVDPWRKMEIHIELLSERLRALESEEALT